MLENGRPPILLEPVRATFQLDRPLKAVHVLDMEGRPTGRTRPVANNSFSLDSAVDRTIYYQLLFATP